MTREQKINKSRKNKFMKWEKWINTLEASKRQIFQKLFKQIIFLTNISARSEFSFIQVIIEINQNSGLLN